VAPRTTEERGMHALTWITFDCYDTLVEFPIDEVTRRILGARASAIALDDFFGAFETLRFERTLGPYLPYRDLLRQTLAEAMRRFGLPYADADGNALVAAIPTFGPFPDAPPALARLRRRCKLAIVSNTDDDIVAGNARRIGVPFDAVITAEQARAYKPSPAVFAYVLRRLGCAKEDVLHVAQGFDYDIMPAHDLGWSRVWINRYGKTGDPAFGPYRELPDLSGLPALLGLD
ncbi:MAG TPA: haloacid dehalogenase type II, partial [Thermomicrobiales bacterium]|nr:haloacid dehalogenase type II [Thermomicrobiales bacterium]